MSKQQAGSSIKDFSDEFSLKVALSEGVDRVHQEAGSSKIPLCELTASIDELKPEGFRENLNVEYPDWYIPEAIPADSKEQTMQGELERLMNLKSFALIEPLEKETREINLDRLSRIARRMFKVKMSFISIIDMGRCLFLAKDGLELGTNEVPRRNTFCSHALLACDDGFYEVTDAQQHPIFKDYPMVQAGFVRYYAAYPLISPEGFRLGVFTIVDDTPRPDGLCEEDKEDLQMLAQTAVDDLVRHRDLIRAKEAAKQSAMEKAKIAHALATPLTGLELSFALVDSEAIQIDNTGTVRAPLEFKECLSTAKACVAAIKEAFEQIRPDLEGHKKHSRLQKRDKVDKTALVVDDSVVVRKSMCRALERLGFEATQAADGQEGLDLLKERKYDIVFCDFLMPRLDGFDCVRLFREWERTNRLECDRQVIIGMSAHASSGDVDRSVSLGMDSHLQKPINFSVLQEISNQIGMSRDEVDAPSKRRRKGQSCLVVTDDQDVSKHVLQVIEDLGWDHVVVNSQETAEEALRRQNWGAVMVDNAAFTQRGLTGVDVVQEFRKWEQNNRIHRQTNVYLLSSGVSTIVPSDDPLVLLKIPNGADGTIPKPFARSDLSRVLYEAQRQLSINDQIIMR